MNNIKWVSALTIAGALVACSSQTSMPEKSVADRVFETNITNNMNIASGEPEITVDPTNPMNIAIVEFALGSDKRPAWKYNPVAGARTPEEADESMRHNSRVMLSNDGGNTWRARPSPANSPDHSPGGGDPMIESGPDGTLYVANEPFPRMLGERGDTGKYTFLITASTDWGKTFGDVYEVGTPVNRPFIKVDQSTGKVYTASTGTINFETGALNDRSKGAVMDRWLVAWEPHLKGRSEPRRFGGPDFSVFFASHIAAHGVVASAFVIGGPTPGMGPAPAAGSPPPQSLKSLIKDGTQRCSVTEPCLFFQTTSDDGKTWVRHHIPGTGGISGLFTYVAADEGRPGRFAVGYSNGSGTGLRVVTTNDWGKTWSQPSTVIDVAVPADMPENKNPSPIAQLQNNVVQKPWMAYGPTGVLGFIWKQVRTDIEGPTPPPQSPIIVWGPGFDVYAGISCDGGETWLPPVRVNAKTSPRGPSAQDDLSYIALDKNHAHLVWGDRRDIDKITNEPMGAGGIQAYYGRVPFSVASKGAPCGRTE